MNKKILFLITGLIISAAFFTKIQPVSAATISVTSPNGGENLIKGTPYTIQWTGGYSTITDPLRSVALMLTKEDGVTQVGWIHWGNSPSGSYSWDPVEVRSAMAAIGIGASYQVNVPDGKYKIRAIDYNDPRGTAVAFDTSDAPFSIVAAGTPSITTSSLSSGTVGVSYTSFLSASGGSGRYNWSATGLPAGLNIDSPVCGEISIALCNTTPARIYGTPTTAGTYTVNVTLTSGTQSASKQLSLVITAAGTASITVLSPNGGESWKVGEKKLIQYNTILSGYSGQTWLQLILLKNNIPLMTVPYEWTIPATVEAGNDYKIEARLYAWPIPPICVGKEVCALSELSSVSSNLLASDKSDAAFSMVNLTNRSPDAPFNLTVASAIATDRTAKLYWQNVNGEKFYIYKNKNDETFQFLAVTTDKFYKDISGLSPDIKYGYYVTAVNIYGESQPSNKVYIYPAANQPSITVLSPNGGEQWGIGKQYSITWNSASSINHVTIALNKSGQYVKNLVRNIISNGSAFWTPDLGLTPGSDYKIRITDFDSGVYDESDNYFSIIKTGSAPTCLPDNTLIKLPDDPKVYVIINCEKKWIQTAEEFKEEGYKWSDVKAVNSPVIQAYADYSQTTADLLRAVGQERVYKVVNGKLIWVPTVSAFNAQGLKWSDVQNVDASRLNQYPRAKLLQASGDPKIYYITESGLKRHIPNETIFDSYGNKWEDVVRVTSAEINSFPDATLIKAEDGYQVYKIENGQKRWIKTDAAFKRLKLDWNKVTPVNSAELDAYPEGAVIE